MKDDEWALRKIGELNKTCLGVASTPTLESPREGAYFH